MELLVQGHNQCACQDILLTLSMTAYHGSVVTTMNFHIIDTPCYPRRWKIVSAGFVESNSWTEYFKTYKEASDEIGRRRASRRRLSQRAASIFS